METPKPTKVIPNDVQTRNIESIKNVIYEIRGQKVMLDSDLADMYEVEVAQLKRQVRRNIERFPKDFLFELTPDEVSSLRCQNGILKTGRGQHSKYAPFAFTEEGVAMNDALDQLRETKAQPRRQIGYKPEEENLNQTNSSHP